MASILLLNQKGLEKFFCTTFPGRSTEPATYRALPLCLLTRNNSASLLSCIATDFTLKHPFIFLQSTFTINKIFFNHCFLFLPLLHRTASSGSIDHLIRCFQCQSYCLITWQSVMCTCWACQPDSDSTTELTCPSHLAFSFSMLCSKHVFCSCCQITFFSPQGLKGVHSQLSSPHYYFSMKNYSLCMV